MWWNNGAVWIVWPLISVCHVWFCFDLISLKSIAQMEYIALPYNTRASALWTPFDDWILGCQKGVAFHAPPETWLKEAVFCSVPQPVTVCYKLETESSRSLLRSWQMADFHDTAQIVANNFSHHRPFTFNMGHFGTSWKRVKTQKRPIARHRVAGCCYWRALISE